MIEYESFPEAMIEVGNLLEAESDGIFAVVYDLADRSWSVFKISDPVLGIRQSMELRYRQYLVLDAFMYAIIGKCMVDDVLEEK